MILGLVSIWWPKWLKMIAKSPKLFTCSRSQRSSQTEQSDLSSLHTLPKFRYTEATRLHSRQIWLLTWPPWVACACACACASISRPSNRGGCLTLDCNKWGVKSFRKFIPEKASVLCRKPRFCVIDSERKHTILSLEPKRARGRPDVETL